jgi:hypothetical protein
MTIDNIFELFDLKHWTSGFATVYQKRGQHNVACLLCGGATIIRRQGCYILSSWELHFNYYARHSCEAASVPRVTSQATSCLSQNKLKTNVFYKL